ncbi:hypothetical protein [Natrinema sp. DC36]|uniref:hypothetical protein n=1 Tax=Natrinema sp. DC36 TaxID=2878680 RepID=UPI001CF0AAFC|nr:hypothetical protein [Natrinema sp. DC36]
MTENPNLVAGDAEGNPLEDQDHLVNGRVPGKGSGLFTENAEGAVTPANGQPLSVEHLQNNISFLDPNATRADWQDELDTLGNNGGGLAVPRRGTYQCEDLAIPSNVTLDPLAYLGAKFTLPDNPSDTPQPVIRTKEGAENVTIRNIEVDGRESEFRDLYGSNRGHGIAVAGDGSGNFRPTNCVVESCYAHDTIRTNVAVAADESTFRDLKLENAATDHWLYIAHGSNNHVKNIEGSGFCKTGGIIVGGNGSKTLDNKIETVHAHNTTTTPENAQPKHVVEFRTPSATGDRGNTTLRDVTVENPHADGLGILAQTGHKAEIDSVYYTGPFDQTGLIDLRSDGSRASELDIRVTDTTTSGNQLIRLTANSEVENVRLREPNTSAFKGVYLQGDGASAQDLDISTGGAAVETYTPSGAEIMVDIRELNTDNSTRISMNGDTGSTYFTDGCMIPQRLASISSTFLYDGFQGFSDGGTGDSTKGPAFWDGGAGNWVSEVDGSTWTPA